MGKPDHFICLLRNLYTSQEATVKTGHTTDWFKKFGKEYYKTVYCHACQCRRQKRCRFDPWVGNIPWRRAWQPTPVFLLGKSHAQRSLAGYGPWGHKELDMSEVTEQQQHAEFLQSCRTLCYPTNCSLPDSSVHGIFQARMLGWVAIPFRGSSRPQGLNLGLLHCR